MIIYALDPPHLCFLDKAGEAKVLEDMVYQVQKKRLKKDYHHEICFIANALII